MEANSLVIRGGNVVTETEILPNHDVVIKWMLERACL